ncbi:ATP-binding protein [Streptomyces sp. NPDC058290]|uniref:ATP-binding protein n=1 Tax=Streptomyces sp. NPDC058290 TaxID=3346426 RepID=UPI0036E021EC
MSEETRTLLLGGGTHGVVTRCRDFTRQALTEWRWITDEPAGGPGAQHPYGADRQEAAEDILLLVSEMVSNACIHAGGPRALVLRRSAGRLRIEVGDGSPEHPRRLRTTGSALPGGHGLLVLERLARSWGCEPYADGQVGKTVWAEVPAPLTAPVARPRGGPTAERPASG